MIAVVFKKVSLVAIFILLSHSAFSQFLFGNSASFLAGTGDFGERYDAGFGVGFNGELKLIGQLGITGEFAWNRWTANGDNTMDIDDANAYNLLVGGKLGLSIIYLEMRVGQYFGDFDEFVVMPAAGVRLGKLDLNAGYQFSGDLNFFNFRMAYFWFGR